MPIIDVHTHIFPESVRKKRTSFCRKDPGFQALYENPQSRLAGLEDLLSSMDQNRIQKSFICGFPWKDPGLCREANDYLRWAQVQSRGRLIAFASLPRSSRRSIEKELHRCLAQGFEGIGELAFYPKGITSRAVKEIAAVLNPLGPLGIPLLIHVSEPVGHFYAGKSTSDLPRVYELLSHLPDCPIILAHWGGGLFFYELMPEVARATRNVFYDTAASPYLYRPEVYSLALKILGANRILFGSDYPLLSPHRYFAQWKEIALPPRARAQIQGRNAIRLLRGSSKKKAQDSPFSQRIQRP